MTEAIIAIFTPGGPSIPRPPRYEAHGAAVYCEGRQVDPRKIASMLSKWDAEYRDRKIDGSPKAMREAAVYAREAVDLQRALMAARRQAQPFVTPRAASFWNRWGARA